MSKDFYIYAHYTLDTNELFYVGKEKGNRIDQKRGRGIFWKNIVKKHGYRKEKLIENLEEPDSLIQEILAIREFSPRANFTKGGEGVSGRISWAKGKKCPDISDRQRGRDNPIFGKKSYKRTPIICQNDQRVFECVTDAAKFYGVTRSNISGILTGNAYSVRGMVFIYKNNKVANMTALKKRLLKKKATKEKSTKTDRCIVCLDNNTQYKSVKSCAKVLKIYISNIHKVLSGERKTTGGYRFQYV